jgi:ABC-type sugar transport system ATPase subunit
VLTCSGIVAGPIQGASFVLAPGLTVLTGQPGCGTSTLLRVLAGVEPRTAGTIDVSSVALLETPPGTEWSDHDVVERALGADHLVGREMWAMSGGERQRVRLANLLASDAQVLLLDEPLGLLDAGGRRRVLDVLRADGRPMLIACKSDEAVLAAADQVLTLADGLIT